MSLIHNEQTKLTATALNGIALTFAGGGFITPLIAFSFGIPGATGRGAIAILIGMTWFVAGVILHMIARQVLTRLQP